MIFGAGNIVCNFLVGSFLFIVVEYPITMAVSYIISNRFGLTDLIRDYQAKLNASEKAGNE